MGNGIARFPVDMKEKAVTTGYTILEEFEGLVTPSMVKAWVTLVHSITETRTTIKNLYYVVEEGQMGSIALEFQDGRSEDFNDHWLRQTQQRLLKHLAHRLMKKSLADIEGFETVIFCLLKCNDLFSSKRVHKAPLFLSDDQIVFSLLPAIYMAGKESFDLRNKIIEAGKQYDRDWVDVIQSRGDPLLEAVLRFGLEEKDPIKYDGTDYFSYLRFLRNIVMHLKASGASQHHFMTYPRSLLDFIEDISPGFVDEVFKCTYKAPSPIPYLDFAVGSPLQVGTVAAGGLSMDEPSATAAVRDTDMSDAVADQDLQLPLQLSVEDSTKDSTSQTDMSKTLADQSFVSSILASRRIDPNDPSVIDFFASMQNEAQEKKDEDKPPTEDEKK